MRWFGESWGAPMNEDCEKMKTPVDAPCAVCNASIEEGDRGIEIPVAGSFEVDTVLYHVDCWLKDLGMPFSSDGGYPLPERNTLKV